MTALKIPSDQDSHHRDELPAGFLATHRLIVGYGNTLRGDDAAGPLVVEALEQLGLPGVAVHVCHQLTPELSEKVAEAEQVIFVDAGEANDDPVEIREVVPGAEARVFGHAADPASLLALARCVFGRSPRAWLATVGARSFELGAAPSPECAAAIALAIEKISALCREMDREEATGI